MCQYICRWIQDALVLAVLWLCIMPCHFFTLYAPVSGQQGNHCNKPFSIGNSYMEWRDVPRISVFKKYNAHVMLSHFVFPFKKFMVALIEGSIFLGMFWWCFLDFGGQVRGKLDLIGPSSDPYGANVWPKKRVHLCLKSAPKRTRFFLGHVRAMLVEHCVFLKRALLRPQFFGAPSFLVLLS